MSVENGSNSAVGLLGLPSELFIKISLDPVLSLKDTVRLLRVSRSSLSQISEVEKTYRIEHKNKVAQIFSMLSASFRTDLGFFQTGMVTRLDQMKLNESEATKALVEEDLKKMIPALVDEYRQSSGENQEDRLAVLSDFIVERSHWVGLALQNEGVRAILRSFYAVRWKVPLKKIDTVLVQRLNGMLSQPTIEMPEKLIVLISNVNFRNGIGGKTVATLIGKKDFAGGARVFNAFPLDREAESKVTDALITTATFDEICAFGAQLLHKNSCLLDVGLKFVELKRLEEATTILEHIDDRRMQQLLNRAIGSLRFDKKEATILENLAQKGDVEGIFEFTRLHVHSYPRKTILEWMAKTLVCDSHFAQAIRVINELQVDDVFMRDLVKFIKKDRLKEAESFGAAVKDLNTQKRYLAEISRRTEAEESRSKIAEIVDAKLGLMSVSVGQYYFEHK